MDFPQQREVPFLGIPFHAPAPQHPPPAPLFDRDHRPLPGQLHGQGGVLHRDDAVFRPIEGREDIPPPVEDIPAQAQPQDLQYANIGHYDMAHDYPPPQGHLGGYIRDAQAYAAPAPIDAFNGGILQAAAGPAPAFPNVLPHQIPVPNGQVAEVLQQIAILYLHDRNSQVVGISREHGQADGETVVITLRSTRLPYIRLF